MIGAGSESEPPHRLTLSRPAEGMTARSGRSPNELRVLEHYQHNAFGHPSTFGRRAKGQATESDLFQESPCEDALRMSW